ncbi:MAG: response regulator [Verrucomicrobiota bacterium]
MRVLIADDDRELASAIASYVRYCNEDVVATVTTGGLDVIRNVDRFQPDIIIMDIMMPRLNGLTICHHILSRFPQTRIILFSGKLDAKHPFVVNSGATAFLAKPVRLSELRNVIEEIIAAAKTAA